MHTLTHFRLCPFSRSIRIALAELGLEAALIEERPWEGRAHFLAMNPAGELPILEMAHGPMLCGAYAISEYLGALSAATAPPTALTSSTAPATALTAATAPDDQGATRLFPGAADEQAEVRRLVDWFHRKFDREVTREIVHEKVTARLRPGGDGHTPDAEIMRAIRANLRYHLKYLNFLTDQREWLAGDDLSFADMAACAHLSSIDYLGEISWDEVPRVKAWYVRLKSRRSLRGILADRLPGQPPPAHYADLDF
jgi:glutathione S-transferase